MMRSGPGNPQNSGVQARRATNGLTVRYISALPYARPGTFYEVSDAGETRYLAIRITPTEKNFYMRRRWQKGAASATSRRLGRFVETDEQMIGPDNLTLARARQKAREWEEIRKCGADPRDIEIEKRKGKDFAALAKDYMSTSDFKKQRQAKASERRIRHNLLRPERNPWMHEAVIDIEDEQVAALIAEIRERAPSEALHVRSDLKLIFDHAVRPENRKQWGLKASPIAHLKSKDFKLKKNLRTFVLSNDEVVALWRAAGKLGYPYDQAYKLLLLTGQRRSDIAKASWAEIDLAERLLKIPSGRFKSGIEQLVPLSDACLEVISSLPGFDRSRTGPFLFSSDGGVTAINGFSVAKKRLNVRMLTELKSIAKARGDDPEQVTVPSFVNHDLRRVVRTALAGLGVNEEVAELVLGHAKVGLIRVYNQHRYLAEMREALQKWANRLLELVHETPERFKAPVVLGGLQFSLQVFNR